MSRRLTSFALLRRLTSFALLATAAAQTNTAIAKMRGARVGTDDAIAGTVTFEQSTADPLGDITVTVALTGMTPGQTHGFHVHQFGDTRVTDALDTMSAHFVPYCVPPEADEDGEITGGCADDQVHGLPPSPQRQPGDMGNIIVEADGTVTGALPNCCGQQKMSLTDPLRSIVGRVVVIHMNEDDGSQPYGGAGAPVAYGVIGIAAKAGNAPLAPNTPKVDKIICKFEKDKVAGDTSRCFPPGSCTAALEVARRGMPSASYDTECTKAAGHIATAYDAVAEQDGCSLDFAAFDSVSTCDDFFDAYAKLCDQIARCGGWVAPTAPCGEALLTLLEPERPGVVRMQAKINGLKQSSDHSFHFHEYGDMTADMNGGLGAIYSSNQVNVDMIWVNEAGTALYDVEYTVATSDLVEHVGRSLTIHDGPTKESPTIAAATCGLANPNAQLDTTGAPTVGLAVSGGVVAVLVITVLVVVAIGAALVCYMCKCALCSKLGPKEVAIPPPPPPKAASFAPPGPPPPAAFGGAKV